MKALSAANGRRKRPCPGCHRYASVRCEKIEDWKDIEKFNRGKKKFIANHA
jgi:hypothetical protein